PQPKEGEILKLTSAWAQFKVDMEPVPEKIAKSLAEMRAVGKGPGIDVATDFLEQISGAAGNLLTNLNLAVDDFVANGEQFAMDNRPGNKGEQLLAMAGVGAPDGAVELAMGPIEYLAGGKSVFADMLKGAVSNVVPTYAMPGMAPKDHGGAAISGAFSGAIGHVHEGVRNYHASDSGAADDLHAPTVTPMHVQP